MYIRLIGLLALAATLCGCPCPCKKSAPAIDPCCTEEPETVSPSRVEVTRDMIADPNIEVLDDEFLKILSPDSRVELISEGHNFTEGPVWMADEGCLLFSDIPEDTIYRWTEADGLSVFRKPSDHANGNTTDLEGRLITCGHAARMLTRMEKDGTITTLASEFNGKKLNSPNDAVVKSDGTIWFTDPPYGIKKDQIEQPANQVFRLDPATGKLTMVMNTLGMPNGLCFSPDEKLLYIADSWHGHDPKIHVVKVSKDNEVSDDKVFARVPAGVPDGMRVDEDGRLYATSKEGVCVYAPDGRLLGKLKTTKTAANCTFGGPDGRTLFITASNNVHKVKLAVRDARAVLATK